MRCVAAGARAIETNPTRAGKAHRRDDGREFQSGVHRPRVGFPLAHLIWWPQAGARGRGLVEERIVVTVRL